MRGLLGGAGGRCMKLMDGGAILLGRSGCRFLGRAGEAILEKPEMRFLVVVVWMSEFLKW